MSDTELTISLFVVTDNGERKECTGINDLIEFIYEPYLSKELPVVYVSGIA
jgi:hypothetical protein